MGFRVRVFLQNPRRPKGKKYQFDRRLVYGVATHNVGTVKKKKIEILNYMNEVGANVLALQETKRTERDEVWKVPGCVVFEHRPKKLAKGNLGIATIVQRDMFPEVLEITENMIWIRCGRGEKKLVICNVYIPTANAGGKKEVVIEDLKKKIMGYAGDRKNVNLVSGNGRLQHDSLGGEELDSRPADSRGGSSNGERRSNLQERKEYKRYRLHSTFDWRESKV